MSNLNKGWLVVASGDSNYTHKHTIVFTATKLSCVQELDKLDKKGVGSAGTSKVFYG